MKQQEAAYRAVIQNFLTEHPHEKAMSLAVGGDFELFGLLMREVFQPPHPVTRDDGTVVSGPVQFGQSICILRAPGKK